MERDERTHQRGTKGLCFNPRAPYGARHTEIGLSGDDFKFQSTRPVWSATYGKAFMGNPFIVSIHAPRMERDLIGPQLQVGIQQFQSTRPVWSATETVMQLHVPESVSIHAPRMERDLDSWNLASVFLVSIHAPRMERDALDSICSTP